MTDFKKINIGALIKLRVVEMEIEMPRICNFLNCTEEEVEKMYQSSSLDTEMLLRWSKLLEYDFFRLYSQHIILYAPPSKSRSKSVKMENSALLNFRKNIYTKEIIDFILETINSGEKTKNQVIEEYRIPKTTLYKWISKYNSTENK